MTVNDFKNIYNDFIPIFGNHLQITMVSNGTHISEQGSIEMVTDSYVIMRTDNLGQKRFFPLSQIFSIEPIADLNPTISEAKPQPEAPAFLPGVPALAEAPSVAAERPQPAPTRQIVDVPEHRQYVFDMNTHIEALVKSLKDRGSTVFYREMNGILNSMQDAIKNRSMHDKYRTLRQKVQRLWDNKKCQTATDYQALYTILGLLAIASKQYCDAFEPFVRAQNYTLAAYAAFKAQEQKWEDLFYFCALLNRENSVQIDQYLIDLCLREQNVSLLSLLLDVYQDMPEMCERLVSCALAVCQENKAAPTLMQNDSPQSAVDVCLSSLPDAWCERGEFQSQWEEFSAYRYPAGYVLEENEQEQTGYISKFESARGNWGFIGQYYFHIAQVCAQNEEDVMLRRLLLEGHAVGLEVKFYFGKSKRLGYEGKIAATDICLSERGIAEAGRRLDKMNNRPAVLSGTVVNYNPRDKTGLIFSNAKKVPFDLTSIRDPYLKAYFENSFEITDQNVTYALGWAGTERRWAVDVCWSSPDKDLQEAYTRYISPEELQEWKTFLAKQAKALTPKIVSREQALLEPFSPLDDWEPPIVHYPCMLSWPPIHTKKAADSKPKSKTAVMPRTSAPPAAPPAAPQNDNNCAAQKRNGNSPDTQVCSSDGAERHSKDALEPNSQQPSESLIGDLITIYLQQPEKLPQAEKLLEKYESRLPREKFLNLKISVFDKMKKNKELCDLYEEALRSETTIAQRSHRLIRLTAAYIQIGEYQQALQTCQRWEQFYTQNRYNASIGKLKSNVPNVNRQKAICYYYLDNKAEAQRIATDLIRSNPADTVANAILSNALTMESLESAILDNTLTEPDGVNDDSPHYNSNSGNQGGEENNGNPEIPRFIRQQINNSDVGSFVKSHVVNGVYRGTQSQLDGTIGQLISDKKSVAPKVRSDRLLVASKILEQMHKEDDSRYFLYCGRAIASWGDYMVRQSSQMDTPRMAYLYSIRLLRPQKSGLEQNWVDSYNRYLKSYFLGQSGLSQYIEEQNRTRAKEPFNNEIFATNRIQDVLFAEFFVGVLQLLSELGDQLGWQERLIDALYSKSFDLRQSICKQLQDILNECIEPDLQSSQFSDQLHKAYLKMEKSYGEIEEKIRRTSEHLLAPRLLLEGIDDNWKDILITTDWTRLQSLWAIFKGARDYLRNTDFESRAECLRQAIEKTNQLQRDIQDEPTDLSYNRFLPALETVLLQLTDAQDILYRDHQPELTWTDASQGNHLSKDGTVMVYLIVQNKPDCQNADRLTVQVQGGNVVRSDVYTTHLLRGGGKQEVVLSLNIVDEAKRAGSFSADLIYTYICNTSASSGTEQVKKRQPFTFVIRSDKFVPLKNPFKNYIGKRMDDESMFYGRDVLIEQLVERICPSGEKMNYGQAIAVYGQTRCGKSSLLYHLKKRLEQRYSDRLLIWDVDNIGSILPEDNPESYLPHFLYTMLDIGENELKKHRILGPLAQQNGLKAPLSEMLDRPSEANLLFNQYIRQLNEILQAQGCIIVLFVDEFTYLHELIRKGRLSGDFMKFWKAFLQRNCVFAVIAGQDDMPEFIKEYENEFASMDTRKLTYLAEGPAKELFRRSLEDANNREQVIWPDGCEDTIYELTAGSAYLTMLLCSNLVDFLNDKGASTVTSGILENFLNNKAFNPSQTFLQEYFFEPQLKERGHEEYEHENRQLLSGIARLSQTAESPDLQKVVCYDKDGEVLSQERIQFLVKRLIERDVLKKEDQSIRVKLLEQWLMIDRRE